MLLILIAAFALAALYFISTMIRRAHARPAPRRGKHALVKPTEEGNRARATATPRAGERVSEPGDDDAPTEPALPITRAAEWSAPSSELFQQRYAAKFGRLHKRVEQLRTRMQEI